MGTINVNAPVETVFEAVSDLSRHAGWTAHEISITAESEGPVEVGHTYSSGKSGKKLDKLTVTEHAPNDRFGFHVVMPNGWELDWLIKVSAENGETKVERKGQITKIPWYFAPMKLLVAVASPMPEGKMAKKMKADLEGSG